MEQTELIYIGRRMTAKGKVAVALITPAKIAECRDKHEAWDAPYKTLRDLTDRIERECGLFSGMKPLGAIGGIYAINAEIDTDGRIKTTSTHAQYARMSGADDLQAAWSAADKATQIEKAKKSAEAKANDNDALARAVDALRRQYQGISPQYRRGFQLWLLDQLEKR